MYYTKNLWLVNPTYPLPTNHQSEQLVTSDSVEGIQLTRTAAFALKKLLQAIDGETRIKQVSGYRDYQTQSTLYRESLVENGQIYTEKYVAKPGCSEHQTGLAIDVGLARAQAEEIAPAFPNEGIAAKFKKEAADFGFILRYPQGKEGITKIAYEPWHYRFVGLPHSQIITEEGWTLEEYYETLTKKGVLCWQENEIYLIRENQLLDFLQNLKQNLKVKEVSPTNQGGLIILCQHQQEGKVSSDAQTAS